MLGLMWSHNNHAVQYFTYYLDVLQRLVLYLAAGPHGRVLRRWITSFCVGTGNGWASGPHGWDGEGIRVFQGVVLEIDSLDHRSTKDIVPTTTDSLESGNSPNG